MDRVILPRANANWLPWILLALMLTSALRCALNVFIGRTSTSVGTRITRELRERLHSRLLELSVDYYDRHFQQAPIGSIVLCPLPQTATPLVEQLEQQTGIPVRLLELEDIVDLRNPLARDQEADCVLAIGAALRAETSQL